METTKKILKCDYSPHWRHYPIIELPIDEIWQSVPTVEKLKATPDKQFRKTLINDIQNDGMHFPIMCVHTTHLELIELKKEFDKRICELPFWHNDHNPQSKKIWSVWGGSQRLNVAKHLGYTHIDAAVLPTVKKAISHQKDMRKPYIKRYYE